MSVPPDRAWEQPGRSAVGVGHALGFGAPGSPYFFRNKSCVLAVGPAEGAWFCTRLLTNHSTHSTGRHAAPCTDTKRGFLRAPGAPTVSVPFVCPGCWRCGVTGPAPWEGMVCLHRCGALKQPSQAGSLVIMLSSGAFTGLRRTRRRPGKLPKPVSPWLVENHGLQLPLVTWGDTDQDSFRATSAPPVMERAGTGGFLTSKRLSVTDES